MKFIIIGLGNFGASLAEKLTALGNEVIGIDGNMARVELYKERITHTICLNTVDQFSLSGLPLEGTDAVIVTIGKDQGANLMTTALFKNMRVKKLISRAINPIHEKILEAIGVDEILRPEEETAERWSKKLCLPNVVDAFELNEDYAIFNIHVPKRIVGKTIGDISLRTTYQLLVLTVIKNKESKSIFGNKKQQQIVEGIATDSTLLESTDILVVFGTKKDLQEFLKA